MQSYRLAAVPDVDIFELGDLNDIAETSLPQSPALENSPFAPLPRAQRGEFYLLTLAEDGSQEIYRGHFESAKSGAEFDGNVIGTSFRAGDARAMGYSDGRFNWETDWWAGLAIDRTPVSTFPETAIAATAVPEPNTLAVVMGLSLMLRRRR